jgi:hypothetical protein
MQIWMAWALAFFLCIAAPAQAMSASKALANPLATKLDTHYFPINKTDPMGLSDEDPPGGPDSNYDTSTLGGYLKRNRHPDAANVGKVNAGIQSAIESGEEGALYLMLEGLGAWFSRAKWTTRAAETAEAAEALKITNVYRENTALSKMAAEAARNQSVAKSFVTMEQKLLAGNLNQGLGSKNLFGNINYLRNRDGARIFFRNVEGGFEILAKASKANEDKVIGILTKLYK